jgi:hypothetical protein
LKKRSDQDIVISQIPLNPPFSKGEVFLLPLAKGGGEGFYEGFFKALKCYKNSSFLLKFFLMKDITFNRGGMRMSQIIAAQNVHGIILAAENRALQYPPHLPLRPFDSRGS